MMLYGIYIGKSIVCIDEDDPYRLYNLVRVIDVFNKTSTLNYRESCKC